MADFDAPIDRRPAWGINAVAADLQARNLEGMADLTAKLDDFFQRQVTAVEKGEVSPEAAGLAAIAALVAAYKLAPKGTLTNVVQSLAKPIAKGFEAAKSRLGYTSFQTSQLLSNANQSL